jgi:hypothetical protein
MTQTKAEQLAEEIRGYAELNDSRIEDAVQELRRLSPIEMELAGTKAASIARQADLMGKNEALKARVKELEDALKLVLSAIEGLGYCEGGMDGLSNLYSKAGVAEIALAQTVGANHD